MTKQGAAKLTGSLVERGYLIAVDDPSDGRARLLRLTERGSDMLVLAAGIQADLETELTAIAGADDTAALRRVLQVMADPGAPLRPVW